MHNDAATAERFHGIAQNITGGCLHDVLHKLRPVGIESLPFLCPTDAFVSDTLAAEFVSADLGLYVGEVPSGGQSNKEHPAPIGKEDTVCFGGVVIFDCFHSGPVYVPPESDDPRIGLTPSIDQLRKLVFGKAHLQRTHSFERTDRAAVAECQFRDLAFLTQVSVDTMLLDRNFEHLAGRGAVDIAAFGKYLLSPVLTGHPCDDAGLDCRKVGDNELVAVFRNKGCSYKLR